MIGMAPSHRSARRIDGLPGQPPPTHMGILGRCTGGGRISTLSIVT